MPKTRVILELGSGNDLHGSDYTKAALRAVQDALHHSSLSFVRTLKVDKTKLDVEVTIGVQRPERVDLDNDQDIAAARQRHREGRQGRSRCCRPGEQRSRGASPAPPLRFASRRREACARRERCTISRATFAAMNRVSGSVPIKWLRPTAPRRG